MNTDPVLDGQYRSLFCYFLTTTKKEWFRHTRTLHGQEYDTLVRQRRAFYRHQRFSTVQPTTVHQLATTNEVDPEVNHK